MQDSLQHSICTNVLTAAILTRLLPEGMLC